MFVQYYAIRYTKLVWWSETDITSTHLVKQFLTYVSIMTTKKESERTLRWRFVDY